MSRPINPAPHAGARGRDLPAYVSNGVIGLRVREVPLQPGIAMVSGFAGEHPEKRVNAATPAPYPLAGEVAVDHVWSDDAPYALAPVDQAYDFATAELTTRITYAAAGARLELTVLTFASRTHPSLVCQRITVTADRDCVFGWRARLAVNADVRGVCLRRRTWTPGEPEPACDGALLWGAEGGASACGLAYVTEVGAEAKRSQSPWDQHGPLLTEYELSLSAGRPVRLDQMTALVPSLTHAQPDTEALRLVAQAREIGFDRLREGSRSAWEELWRGRIRLHGADERWQGLADAAFFYLHSSVHASSPAATSIFGLASWHDYHYYYGHVMWDVDCFGIPVLALTAPDAARSLLDFRSRGLVAARNNAKLHGYLGLQFPWETAPTTGEEATPGAGTASWREIHVGLHVARAFAVFSDATGNRRFLEEQAWPVLRGVADFMADRMQPAPGGRYRLREAGGPVEQKEAHDNDSLTVMGAKVMLRRAQAAAHELGRPAPEKWARVAEGLRPPIQDGVIVMHDRYDPDEEQGASPSALLALFPYWAEVEPDLALATLSYWIERWQGAVGVPMLPALYPTWACWAGARDLAATLLEEGYGKYAAPRFLQTLENRTDIMADATAAGPFFANIGGFLSGLLMGMPGLNVSAADPASWPQRPVVLPSGWDAIEAERIWVRGRPMRLLAQHGAERAELKAL